MSLTKIELYLLTSLEIHEVKIKRCIIGINMYIFIKWECDIWNYDFRIGFETMILLLLLLFSRICFPVCYTVFLSHPPYMNTLPRCRSFSLCGWLLSSSPGLSQYVNFSMCVTACWEKITLWRKNRCCKNCKRRYS